MDIGLILTHSPPEKLVEIARHAEKLGFESVWQGEHFVLPIEDKHEHPYGKVKIDPKTPFFAPFVQLAAAAAATSALRVATGVILPPMRDVFVTAREIITLDTLSHGRLDVGVGIGWHPDEFSLMGHDFRQRGARTNDFIDALKRLLTESEPSFTGEHISFDAVGFEPKPTQSPHPPILVGGDSLPAMRRAARRGNGWYGHADSPEQAKDRIETMTALLMEEVRVPADFHIALQVWNPPPDPQAYFDAGADRIVVAPFQPAEDPIAAMEAYAARINLAPRG